MQTWVLLSILLFLLLAAIDISYRYFIGKGYTPLELVVFSLVPTIITAILYVMITKTPVKVPKTMRDGILFGVIGIASFFTFLMLRYAQKLAPNIGYVNAIMYSSVLLTIVATSLYFKDNISIHAFLGAVFVIAGIALITMK